MKPCNCVILSGVEYISAEGERPPKHLKACLAASSGHGEIQLFLVTESHTPLAHLERAQASSPAYQRPEMWTIIPQEVTRLPGLLVSP